LAKKVNKIFGTYFSAELALVEKADKKLNQQKTMNRKTLTSLIDLHFSTYMQKMYL